MSVVVNISSKILEFCIHYIVPLLLIPVGLSVWPASIILSQWVAARGNGSLVGKSVLELGAGCGLPAIVACLPAVFVVAKCNLTPFFTIEQSPHCVFLYRYTRAKTSNKCQADAEHADAYPGCRMRPYRWSTAGSACVVCVWGHKQNLWLSCSKAVVSCCVL
jgi:hypothetical protein